MPVIQSIGELRERLAGLPNDERERAYDKALTKIAVEGQEKEFDQWAQALMNPPEGREETEKVSFAAFAVRVTHCRRMRNSSGELELMTKWRSRFQPNHPYYNHLWLMCRLASWPEDHAEEIMELARDNVRQMPNPGTRHALAIAVADIFEALEFSPERLPSAAWLREATDAVEQALREEPYAKFYCTKGRLLALQGRHEEGIREIAAAIDREDPEAVDYAMRIGEYRMYRQYIQNQLRSKGLLEEMKRRTEEQSNQTLSKNLEFLGLFAGLVSFTIGGIGIATGVAGSALDIAGLLVVLMGALLEVFAGLGTILHGWAGEAGKRNLLVLGLGCLMILLGGVAIQCLP